MTRFFVETAWLIWKQKASAIFHNVTHCVKVTMAEDNKTVSFTSVTAQPACSEAFQNG